MEWNGTEWNGMECNVCMHACMYVCIDNLITFAGQVPLNIREL